MKSLYWSFCVSSIEYSDEFVKFFQVINPKFIVVSPLHGDDPCGQNMVNHYHILIGFNCRYERDCVFDRQFVAKYHVLPVHSLYAYLNYIRFPYKDATKFPISSLSVYGDIDINQYCC